MSAVTAASDDEMHAEIERLRAENESLKQQLAQSELTQCRGIPRKGCNYLSQQGRICNKCGHEHKAYQLAQRVPDELVSMVDAAMVEMSNIHPPLRRSECERLICAALSAAPAQPSQPTTVSNPAPWPWPLETDMPRAQKFDATKEHPAVHDFAHWLNARRSLSVSECFHEIVACYEAAAHGIKE